MRDIDLPGSLKHPGARNRHPAVAHRTSVHECRGIAGDEDENFRRVAETVVTDRDPAHDVGRDVVEKDQPERDPSKQIKPQVALTLDGRSHESLRTAGRSIE